MGEGFPELRIEIAYFDEGWYFAGDGVVEVCAHSFEVCDATDALYEQVYGEAPERFGEDEETAKAAE